MTLRSYAARAAALALILAPTLAVSAATEKPTHAACACAVAPNTAVAQETTATGSPATEPSEEVRRIWTSP